MKRIISLLIVGGLLLAASTCFAQMYTVTDITPPGSSSEASGLNNSGQVVGNISGLDGFRTYPNSPLNTATDLIGVDAGAADINDSGQVVGGIRDAGSWSNGFAFRTAPNSLVPLRIAGPGTYATGINASGQVIVVLSNQSHLESFRTAPNAAVDPVKDGLGALPSSGQASTYAEDINDAGQVVGASGNPSHAFRTAPNRAINPATDDLGTLGGITSSAKGINNFGQVVGGSWITGNTARHAFRTAPNAPINPATDDLGSGEASAINDYGEVVGTDTGPCDISESCDSWGGTPFLYSNGTRQDLNKLIAPTGASCGLSFAIGLNNSGQIVAYCNPVFDDQGVVSWRSVLLTPIYKAFVRPPIKGDGSSVFAAHRGVLPVKFKLTKYQAPTCNLPPATIAITKVAGGALVAVSNHAYIPIADNGSQFRTAGCEYHYNLPTFSLGVGTYRVDISINGIFVGHAVFALK